MIRKLLILFFFIILNINISAQKSPKLPNEPKLPEMPKEERDSRGDKKSNSENGKNSDQDSTDINSANRELLVTLCDGRKVKGKWEQKEKEINLTHIKEGIKYQKKIQASNMLSVKILTWKAVIFKEEKDGTAYKMIPSQVRLETRTGETYDKDMGLDGTEYSILKLENENGHATIYSLWMDFLSKDGSWYTKLDKITADKERKDCFKDVMVEMKFLN